MKAGYRNNLKGAAVALLLAGGTGLLRVFEGVQGLLHKASAVVAANVSDIKMMADASHDE